MIRGRTVVIGIVLAIAAITCARLGFWQLERLGEKRRMNADRRAALERPPLMLGDSLPPASHVAGHIVAVRGTYDSLHVLLAGRTHDGEPGVEVLTPLRVGNSGAVLVDRGWLGAEMPANARPEDSEQPGERVVRGLVEEIPKSARGATLRPLPDRRRILMGLRLDPDTLAARLPYAVAGFTIRELPGPDVPAVPLRTEPPPFDESVHLGYAVQWFAMAVIIAGGSVAFARSRRRAAQKAGISGGSARL